MCEAFSEAANQGHLFIAAAGNDGADVDVTPFFPCTCREVLCVASTGPTGDFNYYTNYGDSWYIPLFASLLLF